MNKKIKFLIGALVLNLALVSSSSYAANNNVFGRIGQTSDQLARCAQDMQQITMDKIKQIDAMIEPITSYLDQSLSISTGSDFVDGCISSINGLNYGLDVPNLSQIVNTFGDKLKQQLQNACKDKVQEYTSKVTNGLNLNYNKSFGKWGQYLGNPSVGGHINVGK